MEVDAATLLRLKNSNQTHLLSYWDQLDHEQRAILLRDISSIDLNRITEAFEGIKDQLVEQGKDESIDDLMEPIPEHLTGSVEKTSKEQLDTYRRQGQLHLSHIPMHTRPLV